MKKKYIRSLLITYCLPVASLLLITGCADFLDRQPPSSISDANFWKSEKDAQMALVGCYRFNYSWNHDDFATPQGLLYLDFAGGNGLEKTDITTQNMASVSTSITSPNIYYYWFNAYSCIAHYNTFLDNIENCPMDETKKQSWTAEVKCLRAYYLFYLAFHFKDVPMPLTTLTLEEANSIFQTPQAEVYKQVEQDLKAAIPVLVDKHDSKNYGRYTKSAASVLLSRLYLAQDKWTEAASALKQVIDSGQFQLDRRNGADSYEKLFQVGGEYSPEMIFCVQYMKDLFTTSRYQYLYPESLGGWHQFSPYNELVKSYFCADGKDIYTSAVYDENDPYINRDLRLYASFFLPPLGSFEGTKFGTVTYNCFGPVGSADKYDKYNSFNGYCPKKGCDPSITNNLSSTYTYTPLMRYAEVLISYIEAVCESNFGMVDQQLLDLTINDIRNRVNLPPYQYSEVSSQQQLRDAIRKERRVELAFEGFRYFDVLRWGTAMTELNHTFTGVKLSDNPADPNYRGSGNTASPVDENMYLKFEARRWAPHNRYFPIPLSELNINKNLKPQEGYN